MINKLISGFVAGLGFSIAVILVVTVWLNYTNNISYSSVPMTIKDTNSASVPFDDKYPFIENFSDLPLDEKIDKATAIIVTNIEKNASGIYQTKVTEILKKNPDVEMYYNVGEIYEDYSDYNKYETEGMFVPKGFIVFMGGNPASMMYSTSFSGGRVGSLGGISLELLREKCSS